MIKNSFGRRRDFRVKMWGTSSPDDKLTGDLRNVIEATSIGGRRSNFLTAEKLVLGNLGLLQQYLPIADVSRCSNVTATPELFDHLIGKLLKMQRHVEAEHLGGLEVDDQLKLGG
jgi:hypothetical protein